MISAADVIDAVVGDHAEIAGVVDIQRIAFIGHEAGIEHRARIRCEGGEWISVLVISEQFLTDNDSITASGSAPGAVVFRSSLFALSGDLLFIRFFFQ